MASPSSTCESLADVAKMWQHDQPRPIATNGFRHVVAGQPPVAIKIHQRPLTVPRFPWYY